MHFLFHIVLFCFVFDLIKAAATIFTLQQQLQKVLYLIRSSLFLLLPDIIHYLLFIHNERQRGYFGNGVRVRVNDGGIESSHPEFAGRIDFSASCDEDVGGVEPFPPLIQSSANVYRHGTVVGK